MLSKRRDTKHRNSMLKKTVGRKDASDTNKK